MTGLAGAKAKVAAGHGGGPMVRLKSTVRKSILRIIAFEDLEIGKARVR